MQYIDYITVEDGASIRQIAYPPLVLETANNTYNVTQATPTQIIFWGTTAGQIFKLPDATYLTVGISFYIWNTSTQYITIQDNTGTDLFILRADGFTNLVLQAGGSVAGTWIWKLSAKSTQSGFGIFQNYHSGQGVNFVPYVERTEDTNFVAGYFNWEGSSLTGSPRLFTVIGSRDDAVGTSYCRLYDRTNAQQLCETSWTTAGVQAASTTAFTNIPENSVLVEIQVRKSVGGSDTRLHSVELTF